MGWQVWGLGAKCDSRCAFATLQVQGAIYKERALSAGKEIKKRRGTAAALGSSMGTCCSGSNAPSGGATRECTHLRWQETAWLTNRHSKQPPKTNIAAKLTVTPVVSRLLTARAVGVCDKEETIWAQTGQGALREDGWWEFSDGRLFVPSRLAFQLDFHQSNHLGKTKTCEILALYFVITHLIALYADATDG